MSVIAGLIDTTDNKILLASDTISVNGSTKTLSNQLEYHKVLEINDMIIGGVGTAQETSLLFQFARTHKPDTPTTKDVLAFVIEFANWKSNIESGTVNNHYLIAYDGHLFLIEHMFVTEVFDYVAIGAGADYALAALYLDCDPELAVKVACNLCAWCAKPVTTYETYYKGDK